jgi:hypothetical protein
MKTKIILYSAWKFIPNQMFIDTMNKLGYEGRSYKDIELRLDKRMIKFIEDNAVKQIERDKIPMYLSTKAKTKGIAGIINTTAWIGEVDLSEKWTIIYGNYPFCGAEQIQQYKIQEYENNYITLMTIR